MSDENPHVRKMKEVAADPHRFAKEHLKAFVERIERVEDERRELSNDKRDIYAEAKANGFSTRAIKNVVKIRNYEREHGREARLSEEAILETYMKALGMLN